MDRELGPTLPVNRRAAGSASRDRGVVESIEILFATLFLTMLFLFFAQVVVWWHAKNILEQAAAEGARLAASADGDCDDGDAAAEKTAARLGAKWVATVEPDCRPSGTGEGALITFRVTARTPAFMLPGTLPVSAAATAPEEG